MPRRPWHWLRLRVWHSAVEARVPGGAHHPGVPLPCGLHALGWHALLHGDEEPPRHAGEPQHRVHPPALQGALYNVLRPVLLGLKNTHTDDESHGRSTLTTRMCDASHRDSTGTRHRRAPTRAPRRYDWHGNPCVPPHSCPLWPTELSSRRANLKPVIRRCGARHLPWYTPLCAHPCVPPWYTPMCASISLAAQLGPCGSTTENHERRLVVEGRRPRSMCECPCIR